MNLLGSALVEPAAFTACALSINSQASVTLLAWTTVQGNNLTLAASVAVGDGGALVVLASPFGAADQAVPVSPADVDQTQNTPCVFCWLASL